MDTQPLYSWESFQPSVLFHGLPALLEANQWVIVALTFLLLVAAHAWAHFRAPNTGRSLLREWYLTLLALAFVLSAPLLLRVLYSFVDELGDSLGEPTPAAVTRRLGRLAAAFPDLESFLYPKESPESRLEPLQDGVFGYANAFWYEFPLAENEGDPWLEQPDAVEPSRWIATEAATQSQVQLVTGGYLATGVFLNLAGAMAWLADAMRHVGFQVLAFLAPLAIAALRSYTFRNLGLRSLMALLALSLWPVAWRIGHLGTEEIFNAYVAHLEGPDLAASDSAFSWAKIDKAFEQASDETAPTIPASLGLQVPSEWLLHAILGAAGLALWVGLVCFGTPWFLHQIVRFVGNHLPGMHLTVGEKNH